MEDFFYLRNTGWNTAEIAIENLDQSTQRYVESGEVEKIDAGRILLLRSPESKELRLFLQNISKELRLDLYLATASETRRQRSILSGRTRNLRLDEREALIVLPVGAFQE